MLFRLPAILQIDFNEFIGKYKLFCSHNGIRYRVIGASRLGDVWLTRDFTKTVGYEKRVNVMECSNWAETP